MQITKRVEFDYGHRVPSHKSKCKNMHGHRGVIEITMEGPIQPIRGLSDDGMVLDFSDIKEIANREVVEPLDHAFIVYERDKPVVDFLESGALPNHKTVVVDFIPTAENLAHYIFYILDLAYKTRYGEDLRLFRVRFFETPNSWADAYRPVPKDMLG